MPQGRIILKSICQSKKMPKLKTDGARLLYTWLLTNLDINGCFSGNIQDIKGQIFTRLKHSLKTIESYLQDLEKNDLIVRYEVDEEDYIFVPDFVKKQPKLRADREAEPTIPLPTQEQLRSNSGVTPGTSKVKFKLKKSISKDKRKKKPFVENSIEFQLSKYLFDLIRKRKPDFKKPNKEKWTEHIDKMIRLDKRKPKRIREIIKWCQQDGFWQNNILSTEKLRKQFDQLELKADSKKEKKEDELIKQAEECSRYAGPNCVYETSGTPEKICKYCHRYKKKEKQ